ncbi:dTDP-4-dehydrorhamnose 3,5-epimerase [Rhodocista pekingensis]|uniref:dTDP-4-dehydrorhamnose 3,5-epimerase n=1 Tax=Rhodocista pekingensis TaxID=201185 RepID=A0ABW2KZI2_9PROT
MQVETTPIDGVLLITPRRFFDDRGYFAELYQEERYRAAGVEVRFMQDNKSLSRPVYTVRGLHFQRPPVAQAKLVQVLRGSIVDVAVDIRHGSPTFGRHVAVTLSAEAGNQLYVPAGFAHGFCTLEPDTEVHYKVSAPYSREHDGGIHWADPALGIEWPAGPDRAVVSDKDRVLPRLADLGPLFHYEGGTDV